MRKIPIVMVMAWLAVAGETVAVAGDQRQMVELPPMMQEHMLGNMRDHLLALNEVLLKLAAGDMDQAGQIAESRIGLSSLQLHGASHMAPFMPERMRTIGTDLHKAASRFAVVAQNAGVEHSYEAQQKVYGALAEITARCNACHAAFRIH